MSMGNLTADLDVNGAGQFSADMLRAADATQHTTIIVHEQRAAWSQLAASAIPAIGSVAVAGVSLAGTIVAAKAQIATAQMSLQATLAVISHQRSIIAGLAAPFTASGAALMRYGGIAIRVASMVVPQLKAISIAVSAVTLTWKALNSEFAKEVGSRVAKNVKTEIDTIRSSASELTDTVRTMASDGWNVVTTAVGNFSGEWGIAAAATAIATATIKAPLQAVAFGLKTMSDGAKVAQAGITALAFTLSTGSTEGAANFVQQGIALREMAKETERVIALQEQQRAGFQSLRSIQESAAASAAQFAELQRIGSLETVAALDAETRALQERAASLNLAGNLDEGKLKEIAELFSVIERRKASVLAAGPAEEKESPVDAMLAQARKDLELATVGQEGFAVAQARAAGATQEQIAALQALQNELATVQQQSEAVKLAEDARAAAEQQQNQLREQGAQRIAALKDQVDLLTKSATAADIAMREMTRQGFTADQVAEVGRLTEQIQALQEKPEKTASSKPSNLQASLRGSSATAELLLRGVGGNKSMEQIAQKQLTVQQQQLSAIKAIQPQPMLVADF